MICWLFSLFVSECLVIKIVFPHSLSRNAAIHMYTHTRAQHYHEKYFKSSVLYTSLSAVCLCMNVLDGYLYFTACRAHYHSCTCNLLIRIVMYCDVNCDDDIQRIYRTVYYVNIHWRNKWSILWIFILHENNDSDSNSDHYWNVYMK